MIEDIYPLGYKGVYILYIGGLDKSNRIGVQGEGKRGKEGGRRKR